VLETQLFSARHIRWSALCVAALASEREALSATRAGVAPSGSWWAADEERAGAWERDLHDGCAAAPGGARRSPRGLAAGKGAARARDGNPLRLSPRRRSCWVAIDELREFVPRQSTPTAAAALRPWPGRWEIVAARSATPVEIIELPDVRLDDTGRGDGVLHRARSGHQRPAVTPNASSVHGPRVRGRLEPGPPSRGMTAVRRARVERSDLGLQGLRGPPSRPRVARFIVPQRVPTRGPASRHGFRRSSPLLRRSGPSSLARVKPAQP